VVVDNEALPHFLAPDVRNASALITYPDEDVIRVARNGQDTQPEPRCLTICRIEPENNRHLLLEALAKAKQGNYVFVASWDVSEYGRKLRAQFKDIEGFQMLDPIYDASVLAKLRENCSWYVHEHCVGGTNCKHPVIPS
jgi:hypothetical protein